jgi:hypothetical protein
MTVMKWENWMNIWVARLTRVMIERDHIVPEDCAVSFITTLPTMMSLKCLKGEFQTLRRNLEVC